MKTLFPLFSRPRLLAALALGVAGPVHGQYEVSSTALSRLWIQPKSFVVPNAANNTPPILASQPQFAADAANSGGSGPVSDSATLSARYPSQIFRNPATGAPTGNEIVLQRSTVGAVFASGVPRYLLGDVIVPPAVPAGIALSPAAYWRLQPAVPGESFVHPAGGTATPVPAGTPQNFYYSPHAERVFATQAGRVTVTWVSRVPDTSGGDGLRYRTREETFSVSSATAKPTRTIYWTEKSFNAPVVTIPSANIETVNPVYSANFPATVATEYQPVGVSVNPDPNNSLPAERRTLWFQKISGVGQLRAYNLEGRIFIEYLGAIKAGTASVHEFLGADIVEVVRTAPSVNTVVNLGEQILPRDSANRPLPLDGSSEWLGAPVAGSSLDGQNYYGTNTRADGRQLYFAERENENPDRVVFYWLEQADAAIHFVAAPGRPNLGIFWPKQKNNYIQAWPSGLSAYAHYTVGTAGSTAANSVQFNAGQLPQVVFQDDPAQQQVRVDPATQRLQVSFAGDSLNRTLLKFTAGREIWYVRLYTQADGRAGFEEGDGTPAINRTVYVGDRIDAPAGYAAGGYIAAGRNYLPDAYIDPFAAGATAAARGAIIPVNAPPGENTLKVWWFRKVEPASPEFEPFYLPGKVGTYTVAYPLNPATIVLASNAGSGDLSGAEIAGRVYVQNDRSLPGFNPNEEHALLLAGRVYALRDDLNDTSADPARYTSEPYALLRYTLPADGRPAVRAFRILREVDLPGSASDVLFDYPVTAGTILQGPMPLPLLPLPLDSQNRVKNREVAGTPDPAPDASSPAHYASFTFADRKGYHWVYRGPHAGGSPTLGMQFYYPMREGFFVPGAAAQPAVGTPLPYLRPLVGGTPAGDAVSGTPLTIVYRPVWPAQAPELRVAETLTLAKFGLPAVLPQASAEVLYQQSVAVQGTAKPSVVLHDPVREKTVELGALNGLVDLPASLRTTSYRGKIYFQGLPPHLQTRFYFDPLRGPRGTLVLLGEFVDEAAGEDYLRLNVLSGADLSLIANLPAADDSRRFGWLTAIGSLATRLETFVENPERAGTYRSNGTPASVAVDALAAVSSPDTAVVDYALTATGSGSGWVTMVFGNGRAFTPSGDPVSVQVFKVAPRLNTGELKVQLSANPLDEQVSLRHSGDFAGRPQDYDFEWRYAPPQGGVAPPIYSHTLTDRLATAWQLVSAPAGTLPTVAEYGAALATTLPRTVTVNPVGFTGGTSRPGLVARSAAGVDFAAGVPSRIVFSADLAELAGFVLYVNGVPALAHNAPAPFTNATASASLIAGGLPRQFEVPANFFQQAANVIEVAVYSTADAGTSSVADFRLHASVETDLVVASGSPWQTPNGTLSNQVVVGGSPTAPLGSPLLVMSDNWFTVRYRPRAGTGNVAGTAWSRWQRPQLVEGWIKRVLAAINPFNQRMRDLANNAVNTDVSLLTQAGQRWEGNVALTLENINDAGLIEIYETVLNRGKSLSVDAGYDYAAANDALLLAAGYLADLYTLLGHEAYADAANPTISVDDSNTVTEVNTSRFSFEGQVASVLEEELALLRGRDDFLAPGVAVAPSYNRLYWNYTRGINSGEALYAVNYNIREKAGTATANGVVDAADAQRMFPQGHGDAYGHYLTALKGYHRLLRNPNFTWTPRSEAVTVLGQSVQIDYFDERKFAAAAANIARTAQQILALTHRQNYRDDPAAGWGHYRDGRVNSGTGTTRHWGTDEWASRATQGAYYHWIVGNALLPERDTDPTHTGVQVIDRTTVPELVELATLAADFQSRLDNVNAHLNPLGLSPGAIAFDISPAELKAGKSHYEQIHERALRSVLNAKGAFDQAARMTRLLRNQENQIDNYAGAIADEERGFETKLIELYGTPYPGEIGPGRTYAQGYAGPDTMLYFIVDRPSSVLDNAAPVSMTVRVPTGVDSTSALTVNSVTAARLNQTVRTVTLNPQSSVAFADTWTLPSGGLGLRSVTGKVQQALLDTYQANIALQAGIRLLQDRQALFDRRYDLYSEMVATRADKLAATGAADRQIQVYRAAQVSLNATAALANAGYENLGRNLDGAIKGTPTVTGLANDIFSGVRAALIVGTTPLGVAFKLLSVGASNTATAMSSLASNEEANLRRQLEAFDHSYELAQTAYEYEVQFRELNALYYQLAQLATDLQRSHERVRNLLAEGERLQSERLLFRQRAAALVQGYRTRDLTFRTFRNEALEQYRSLFDLAGRYTYLAAKSYDYETGLLGGSAGQSVISGIVAARALGDLTGGVPQATVSTLGDAGLAGTMARLQADWSVAEPRLGINNPDQNGTLFSLRRELFRILDGSADDPAWQQTLEQHIMTNVMADPDVASACRNLRKPDGSPVPGIVIPFRTTVEPGLNFFGLPLAAADHAFSASNFATKIYSVGMVFRGYIGMDPFSAGTPNAGVPNSSSPNALSATPYVYLIPTGTDYLRAPPLGDTGGIRAFAVRDQALPLPFNLGASAFSSNQFYNANGTLGEAPWILRKHQAFRPVHDPAFFYSSVPAEFTGNRLVGRSVWNSGWKLVIPANTLLANEPEGLNRFVASVKDIELFLRTYAHAGN